MVFVAVSESVTDNELPIVVSDIPIKIQRQIINKRSRLLAASADRNELQARFACGVSLIVAGSPTVTGEGQVLLTSRGVKGMISSGTYGSDALDEGGTILLFGFDYIDAPGRTVNKNWRGKPVSTDLLSGPEAQLAFKLSVYSVVAQVKNSGEVILSSVEAFVNQTDPNSPFRRGELD